MIRVLGKLELEKFTKKSNPYYTRGITSKRVTSGGVHLRGLAPGQHSSEETSQRTGAAGNTASDLTETGIRGSKEV